MKTIITDFNYLAAKTLDEALDLLCKHKDDDYRIIAGGQSLNTAMKHRLLTPEYILDIKGVADLDYVRFDEKEGLKIGALATHRSVELSPVVREKYEVLREMEENVASIETRNWGTLMGDLCNADPAVDPAPPLIALDAEITVSAKGEERTVPAEEFAVDFFETVVQPGEMATEIRVPPLPPNTGVHFMKYSQIHGDYALASASVLITLDAAKEQCVNARIGLGGVGVTPIRAKKGRRGSQRQEDNRRGAGRGGPGRQRGNQPHIRDRGVGGLQTGAGGNLGETSGERSPGESPAGLIL